MSKKYNHSNGKTKPQPQVTQSKPAMKRKRAWWVLAMKFLFLFAVVISVVVYTDAKGFFEPDQSNNHTDKKWNSFYRFTETDTVDVVLVGNSHCYAGVNPKNLSAALGVNCFVLASPGTTIIDSYYCLEEALERTHPTVAIIETYCINDNVNRKLTAGALSDQFKSYNARKNLPLKLASMPMLFSPENYAPAWSKTIRNHDFIFRDRAQLEANAQLLKQPKQKKEDKLYLGRFVSFTSGIVDTTMIKYDSLGAPVDGSQQKVNDENVRYVQKAVDLCHQYHVIPVFVTIPMYYRHIEHYDDWKRTIDSVITSTGAAWLDLQEPYDTTIFDPDCFENTYKSNQHMTYRGSVRSAYKIAHFLEDSLKVDLPRRSDTKHWNDMFYGEEGYFENYASREDDTTNVLICRDTIFNEIEIVDCLMIKREDNNQVLLKIKRGEESGRPSGFIQLLAAFKYEGQRIVAYLDCYPQFDYDPITHYLYTTGLIHGAELLEILDATREDGISSE